MFSDAPGDRVGPAPWYWKTFPDPGAPYEWRLLKDARGISYPVLFRDATPVLQVAIYGRVLAADEGHLMLWGPVKPKGVLVVETFALAALKPLKKGSMADAGVPWIAAVRPLDHLQIPQGLPAGRRERRYPAQAGSTLDEVLLLANGPDGTPTAASIYSWRTRDGTVDVIPQPWFNENAHDLGYQWITRVWRDPATRHIFGEGFRIQPFELDENGAWLRAKDSPPSA